MRETKPKTKEKESETPHQSQCSPLSSDALTKHIESKGMRRHSMSVSLVGVFSFLFFLWFTVYIDFDPFTCFYFHWNHLMTNRSEDNFEINRWKLHKKKIIHEIPSQITLKMYYILKIYNAALGSWFYFRILEMKRRNEIHWNAENTKNDQFKINDSLSDTCALWIAAGSSSLFLHLFYHSQ